MTAEQLVQTLLDAKGNASIFGVEVDGDVDLDSRKFDAYVSIRNTTFHGHVNLRNFVCEHTLDLSGCAFKRNLMLAGARVGGSLLLRGATVAKYPQPARLRGMDKSSESVVDLERLRVKGNLDLEGFRSFATLDLTDASIEGRFWFASSPSALASIGGDLEAPNLKVGGQMSLFGVDVASEVNLQGAELAKDLFVRPYAGRAVSIAGQLWMVGASVAGVVNLSGAQVNGDFQLRNARVKEDLIANPFDGGGTLGTLPTVIGGDLVTTGAHFEADIDLNGTRVVRGIILDGTQCNGELSLAGANAPAHRVKPHRRRPAGPPLRCEAAALRMVRASFGAAVIDGSICGTPPLPSPMHAARTWSARVAKLGIRLPAGAAAPLPLNPAFDLSYATVGQLRLVLPVCGPVNMEGITFRDVSFEDDQNVLPDHEVASLLAMTEPFQRATYLRFEKWSRDRGDDATANRVYRAMRRRSRAMETPFSQLWAEYLVDWLTAYGTQSWRAAILLVLVIACTGGLFLKPGALVPKTPAGDPAPTRHTWGTAYWVATKYAIPVLSVAPGDQWKPSSARAAPSLGPLPLCARAGWWITYDEWASVVSVVGWILVPLLVASISGVLKRT